MQVDLVSVETADGVRLDGALRTPTAGASASLGLDAVICHHGVTAKFYGPSFFDGVGDELLRRGCAVLRVNNRGHDVMYPGPHGPLGSACEIVDDSRLDFRAWLDFAANQLGYRRIALWGHSLGAVKTIYYLSVEDDPRVVCAIASSPPRFNYEHLAETEQGRIFVADVERAEQLVADGQPRTLIAATLPTANLFAAGSYADKYGPANRYDIFKHLEQVRVPILVTLGGTEGGPSFGQLAEQGDSLAQRMPHMSYASIAQADHGYTGKVAELWGVAEAWLGRVASPAGVA